MYDFVDILSNSGVVPMASGFNLSGLSLSGVVDELSGSVVNTGSGFLEGSLISTPSVFWYWLLGVLKDIVLWCLDYWYVPVIIIVVYCLLLFAYNYLWSFLLSKLQKKNG